MTSAIVLAAGHSQRMGQPKLLLPFGRTTVIGSGLEALLGAGVDELLVVLRPEDTALKVALERYPVRIVENPDRQGEMLGSVRRGLRALSAQVDTIVVTPADLPGLRASLITRMLKEFLDTGRGILVPVHQGRRGHPLVLAARYREDVMTRFDGRGLRGLLEAHPAEVCEWPAPDPSILGDLDTPEDYQRALHPGIR